ncbi:hypothetical protein ASF41_23255 [Methylobacterium sp. Leaf111]|nr:hypothetical protein [Methylobacterium sp. Leaf111]KQP53656.1 hypothetical protein ASF41_23255 [Methylobacterium sp. Leaf111]
MLKRIWQWRDMVPTHGIATLNQLHHRVHRSAEPNPGHRGFAIQGWAESLKQQFLLERSLDKDLFDFVTDRIEELDAKPIGLSAS